MQLEELSPEMRERVRACNTPEEVLALAKEGGYELSDDELDGIAGGSWCSSKEPGCTTYCATRYSIGV